MSLCDYLQIYFWVILSRFGKTIGDQTQVAIFQINAKLTNNAQQWSKFILSFFTILEQFALILNQKKISSSPN